MRHGTRGGYVGGCRCDPCTGANRAYIANYRSRPKTVREPRPAAALTGEAPPEFPNRLCGPETQHLHYPPSQRGRNIAANYKLATAICTWCDHQPACADWAIAHREPYGVWGGTTPRQRRQLGHITPDTHAQPDHTTQHEDTA